MSGLTSRVERTSGDLRATASAYGNGATRTKLSVQCGRISLPPREGGGATSSLLSSGAPSPMGLWICEISRISLRILFGADITRRWAEPGARHGARYHADF